MPLFRSGNMGQLNQEECFRLWIELGTLKKVRQVLYDRGVRSKPSGKMFVTNSIRVAALTWLIYHPDEAYKLISEKEDLPRDDFNEWMVYRALTIIYSEKYLREWLKQVGFFDSQKYRYIYDEKYPYIHDEKEIKHPVTLW